MASFYNTFRSWFGRGGAISETVGQQNTEPGASLIPDTTVASVDGAMQISTVWACIDRRAMTIASLPFFVYEVDANGQKSLARKSRLYDVLHTSPNSRMTPFEFWRAMVMNHDLRGNAYARLERDSKGEVIAMWPMPSDQVDVLVLPDSTMVYRYSFGSDIAILSAENVLHLKNLGNGTIGLAKLEFMRSATDEATKSQAHAAKIFGSGGKPTGVLMLDKVLNPEQRKAMLERFAGMAEGNAARLYLLEASMKYQQLSINPADQQLLETRKFNIEELCRWFDMPPVMVGHSNVTAWGSGISELVQGWHTLSLRPMLVNIEQALQKRVMTSRQRATMHIEISFDALLRGNPTQRSEMYSKAAQNGWLTRAEIRQLEGWPAMAGTDVLTAQSNLLPLAMLGQTPAPAKDVPTEPVLQAARLADMQTKAQDARHLELVSMIKADSKSGIVIDMGKALFNVTHEAPAAPIVQVSNVVNPTPVNVQVTNDVAPTPVEVTANFEAVVQPAKVELSMPARKTEGTVTRNDKGEIISTTTTERSV